MQLRATPILKPKARNPREVCRVSRHERQALHQSGSRDDEIRALATTPQAVERLWDVCQIPDYRKISPATHAELVTTLYGFLMRQGNIAVDWFARQVDQADQTGGDIDTLSNRIAVMYNGALTGIVNRSEATIEIIGALMTGSYRHGEPHDG